MAGRRIHTALLQEISRGERYSRAEWMLLGVSALALMGVIGVLARFAS